MDFDSSAAVDEVIAVLKRKLGVAESTQQLLACARREQPQLPLWDRIAKVEYAAGAKEIADGFAAILDTERPAKEYNGFYFGLDGLNMPNGKGIEFGCSKKFKSTKRGIDWAYECERYLSDVPSQTFERLYGECRIQTASLPDYAICLGFLCVALTHAFTSLDASRLLGDAKTRAVACGFHDGDLVLLGVRRSRGFELLANAGPFPLEEREFEALPGTRAGDYFLVQRWGQGWTFTIPFQYDDDLERVRWKCRKTGTRAPDGRPVSAIATDQHENPLDLTHEVFGELIVNQRAADFLIEHCATQMQLIPLAINGVAEPHYLLNVFAATPCLDLERSKISEDSESSKIQTIWTIVLKPNRVGARSLFRLGEQTQYVIASRKFRDAWKRAGLTGLKFEPVLSSVG